MEDSQKNTVDVSKYTLVAKDDLLAELTEKLTKNIREAFSQAAGFEKPSTGPDNSPDPQQEKPSVEQPLQSQSAESFSQQRPTPKVEREARPSLNSDDAIAFERSVEKGVASILKAQADLEKRLAYLTTESHTHYGKRIAASIDHLLEEIHEPHRWNIARQELNINKLATSITQNTTGRERDLLTEHLETLRREFAKELKDRATPLGRLQFLAERSNLNPVHAAATILGARHRGVLSVLRFAAHTYSAKREHRHQHEAGKLKGAQRIAEQLAGTYAGEEETAAKTGLSSEALDRLRDIRKGTVRRRAIEELHRGGHITDAQHEQLQALYPVPKEEPEEQQRRRRPVRAYRDEDDEDYEDEPARPRRRRSKDPSRMSPAEIGRQATAIIHRWEADGSEGAPAEDIPILRSNIASTIYGADYKALSPESRANVDRILEDLREGHAKGAENPVAPPVRIVRPSKDIPVADQVMDIASVIANPLPKAAAVGGLEGHATSVPVPGGGNVYNVRYAVREMEDVQASHDPHSFEKNPNYAYENDRNYSQAINAERVIRQAKKFDPRFLVTDNPDAVNGPPIVDEGGNVLGGNSRAMTLGRVYTHNPERAEEYRKYLVEQAKHYGINPDAVLGMRNPILVRMAADVHDPQQAITDLNKTGTASLTASERAIADSRRVSRRALEYLGDKIQEQGEDSTLIKTLSGPNGIEIVNRLIEDGVLSAQERGQYIDSKRKLVTPEAKQRIARLMVGQFFENSSEYEDAPPEVLQKLEKIVAPLARVQDFPEWDLTPHVREAIAILTEARSHGIKNLDLLNTQPDMYGNPRYNPTSMAVAKKLQEGPNISAAAFRKYASDAQFSKPGMPLTLETPPTLPEAFKESFGFEPGEMLGPKEVEERKNTPEAPVYTELAKPLIFGEDPEFVKPDEESEPVLESKSEAIPSLLPDARTSPAESEPVPESGKQWSVYHATDAEPANAFDPEVLQSPEEPGLLGSGIYFSTDKSVGRDSRNLLSANVSLRKPLELSLPDWKTNKTDLINKALGTEGLKGADLTQGLRAKGYDGVTVDYSPVGYNHTEVMALHPDQVRDVKNERPSPVPAEESGLFGNSLFGGEGPESSESAAGTPELEAAEPGDDLFGGGGLFGGEEGESTAEQPSPLFEQPETPPVPALVPEPWPTIPEPKVPEQASAFRAASESVFPPKRTSRAGGPPYRFVTVAPGSRAEHLIDYEDDEPEVNHEPVRMNAAEPEPTTLHAPVREGHESEQEPSIVANRYRRLWEGVQRGETEELGQPSALLTVGKGVRALGGLQDIDQLKVLDRDISARREHGELTKEDVRDLLEKYAPQRIDSADVAEESTDKPLRDVASKLDGIKKAEDDQLKELKDINHHLNADDEQDRLDEDARERKTQDWQGITPEEPIGERPGAEHGHGIFGALAMGAGEGILGGILRAILPASLGAFIPGGSSSMLHHVGRWAIGGHERERRPVAGEPVPDDEDVLPGEERTAPMRESATGEERGARGIVKYEGEAAKGVEATEEAGGFFGKLGRIASKFPSIGMLGKIAGRLAIPLTIIMGIIDFFSGFLNADSILGRSIAKITIMDRFAGGIGGVVKGLVGIVDMLFGLVGVKTNIGGMAGKTIGRLVDDLLRVVGIIFKVAAIALRPIAKLLADGFQAIFKLLDFAILTPLEDGLNALDKLVDTFSKGIDWVFSDHNPLMAAVRALSGIKTFLESVVNVFESLSLGKFASWISGFFHTAPVRQPVVSAPVAPKGVQPGTGTAKAPAAAAFHHDNIMRMDNAAARPDVTKGNAYSDAPPTGSTRVPSRMESGPASDQPQRQTSDYAKLGALSTRYESHGDAGAVNTENAANDPGGYSYGLYQITTKAGGRPNGGTMVPFLAYLGKNNPDMAKQLTAAGGVNAAIKGSPQFIQAWKKLAADPKFADAQHRFIGKELYEPVARVANRLGLDLDHRSDAVKEMLFSTAVNSPAMAERILQSVFRDSPARNKRLTDQQVIERFQGYKVATADQSYRNPKTAAVMRERFQSETADLLAQNRPVPIPAGTDGAQMPGTFDGKAPASSLIALRRDAKPPAISPVTTRDTSMYPPKVADISENAVGGAQLRKASAQNSAMKLATAAPVAPAIAPTINQRSTVVKNNNTLAADISPRNNENTYRRNMDQMYYPT